VARLGDVAELVDEDHQHEAERKRPTVEPQRVRGDRDEEAEELDEDEAPLERRATDEYGQPAGALERAAQASLGVNRLLVLELVHQDPLPIHSSPPA
jgi:hypothetical protein